MSNSKEQRMIRKIVKLPSIQKMINDHFSLDLNGSFEYKNSPQPLEKAIIDMYVIARGFKLLVRLDIFIIYQVFYLI